MPNFSELLVNVFEEIGVINRHLGSLAAEEVEPTPTGKRQSQLESEIVAFLKDFVGGFYALQAEDYDPITPEGAEFAFWSDPVDGTAGLARGIDSDVQASDAASVICVTPNRGALTFGDVIAAGGINLRSGQIWVAEIGAGAWRCSGEESLTRIEPVRLYHKHSPLLASGFGYPINCLTLGVINQVVEYSDLHSSWMAIMQVCLGKADCYLNNVLPDICEFGQRGHELAAVMPFVYELGGYAMDVRTQRPLVETPFTFDGMTPVIIGVDQATVEYYWSMIQENLARPASRAVIAELGLPDVMHMCTIGDLIRLVYKTLGRQPASLRPLAA